MVAKRKQAQGKERNRNEEKNIERRKREEKKITVVEL